MKKLTTLLIVVLLNLSACSMITKVDSGNKTIAGRIVISPQEAWNETDNRMVEPVLTWTMEGLSIDKLQFFVGIPNGTDIVAQNNKESRALTFKATMQAHEIVALYQTFFSSDGSIFTLKKLEPTQFLGNKGFRFEYLLVRKQDEVVLQGVAYGAVINNQLFVMNYSAPRLTFFPRYQARVEALMRGAQLKQ